MAQKGKGLISEETWNEMHSEDTMAWEYTFYCHKARTRFTKGGVNYYKNLPNATEFEKHNFNKNREGFYGKFLTNIFKYYL